MATELDLNGESYRIGRLTTMQQLYITKRITPVVLGVAASLGAAQGSLKEVSLQDLIGPLGAALTQLSDSDLEFVIGTCLNVVQLKQGSGYFPVWSAAAKAPAYDNIDLPMMIRLVVEVVKSNLAGFTTVSGLLQSFSAPPIPR